MTIRTISPNRKPGSSSPVWPRATRALRSEENIQSEPVRGELQNWLVRKTRDKAFSAVTLLLSQIRLLLIGLGEANRQTYETSQALHFVSLQEFAMDTLER
jgi:hypothetical protein